MSNRPALMTMRSAHPSIAMLRHSLPRVFSACEDRSFEDLIAALDRPASSVSRR